MGLVHIIKNTCQWVLVLLILVYFILCHLQVDAGHIYGDNLDRQLDLRLNKDGKLKYQVRLDLEITDRNKTCSLPLAVMWETSCFSGVLFLSSVCQLQI